MVGANFQKICQSLDCAEKIFFEIYRKRLQFARFSCTIRLSAGRDGGAAERARFEIVLCRNVYKGSNPFLCAKIRGRILPPPYFVDTNKERDLRVEAIAGAIGLRSNCSDTEKTAANSTIDNCRPGRAAKGANPFLCAKIRGRILPPPYFADTNKERDLKVEAIAGAIGLRSNCSDTEKAAANSTIDNCRPGRAAKGANPFLCAKIRGRILPPTYFVDTNKERDLKVERYNSRSAAQCAVSGSATAEPVARRVRRALPPHRDCGSNRFAVELLGYGKDCRKLDN